MATDRQRKVALMSLNYTPAQIAETLGISPHRLMVTLDSAGFRAEAARIAKLAGEATERLLAGVRLACAARLTCTLTDFNMGKESAPMTDIAADVLHRAGLLAQAEPHGEDASLAAVLAIAQRSADDLRQEADYDAITEAYRDEIDPEVYRDESRD